ncbi:hypothetical protein ACKOY1_004500, partial [Salmonella enterica subsp. enterica serovar Enteritidis]
VCSELHKSGAFISFFECPFGNSGCRVTVMIRRNQVWLSVWSGLNVAIPEPVLLLMYFQPQAFLISGSSSSNWPKNLRNVE